MDKISESTKKSKPECNIVHLVFQLLSASGGFASLAVLLPRHDGYILRLLLLFFVSGLIVDIDDDTVGLSHPCTLAMSTFL